MNKLNFLESITQDILEGFFESSNVGMAILDCKLRYCLVNHYLATVHGVSTQAHVGKHVRDVLGALTAQVEPALQHVLDTNKPVCGIDIVGTLPGSSATWHWIVNYFPIPKSDGTIQELGAVILEVPKHARIPLSQKAVSAKRILRSWKEIADYVGACIKTVQRWESTLGLPVRRLNPNKGATVFALSSEVDEWLDRTSRFA